MVPVHAEQLEELRAHSFDALSLRRQDVLEFFRKEPVSHQVPSELARLADEKQDEQADQHRGKPEKTDLSVSELRYAAKGIAPQRRKKKRQ
jgi:hypothetical protein